MCIRDRGGWAGQGIVRGVEGSGGREGFGRIGGREKSGGRRVAAGEGEECWGGRAMGAGRVVGGEGEKWRQEKEWWEGEERGPERELCEGV